MMHRLSMFTPLIRTHQPIYSLQIARRRLGPVIQRASTIKVEAPASILPSKLNSPADLAKLIIEYTAYKGDQAKSLSTVMKTWYQKKYGTSLKDSGVHVIQFASLVEEMVNEIDGFTDHEGYRLEEFINSYGEDLVPIGYSGGDAAYADDILKNGLTARVAIPGRVDSSMQIGNGFYVATSIDTARGYARDKVAQGRQGIVYQVFLDFTKIRDLPVRMKGVSVTEWWKQFKSNYDDEYDILIAEISGERQVIQYKINNRALAYLTFKVIERI